MTCVGLLGMAIGHGAARKGGLQPGKPVEDPRVVNGLVALSRLLDEPMDVGGLDLYFLWSVERVGVLYNLPRIAEKDWYRWGVDLLLPSQMSEGNWANGTYIGHHPTLDTCFALLFLKQANLARDLTARLPFDPKELSLTVARRAAEGPTPSESRGRPPSIRGKEPR
jgi:hypothetical protein